MQYVKIPEERIGVLIGEGGSVKKEIERRTSTRIVIDENSVSVETEEADYMKEMIARDIVHAIGRGFNPEIALKLASDGYCLEIIHLSDFATSPKTMETKKGRVIGERGKCKSIIEKLTESYVSVYGKTIAIIGMYENVQVAKEAILRLLEGGRHASVFSFLEKKRPNFKSASWGREGIV